MGSIAISFKGKQSLFKKKRGSETFRKFMKFTRIKRHILGIIKAVTNCWGEDIKCTFDHMLVWMFYMSLSEQKPIPNRTAAAPAMRMCAAISVTLPWVTPINPLFHEARPDGTISLFCRYLVCVAVYSLVQGKSCIITVGNFFPQWRIISWMGFYIWYYIHSTFLCAEVDNVMWYTTAINHYI